MKRFRIFRAYLHSIAAIIFLLTGLENGFSQQETISIQVSNIRTGQGWIALALYSHPDQYPDDPEGKFAFEKALQNEGSMEIILDSVPPGTYVISLLDDEDKNGQMKFGILRMPKEGYGFSNNAEPKRSEPPYEECSFVHERGITRLEIRMQYFRQ